MKPSHQAVRELFQRYGPMTGAEVASYWPAEHRRTVSAIISTLHRDLAHRQLYVSAWTRKADGQRDYLRAVYALGNQPDVRKLGRLTNAERVRRYKAKLRAPLQIAARVPNSVWQLGALT